MFTIDYIFRRPWRRSAIFARHFAQTKKKLKSTSLAQWEALQSVRPPGPDNSAEIPCKIG